jgi:hypothetical protein
LLKRKRIHLRELVEIRQSNKHERDTYHLLSYKLEEIKRVEGAWDDFGSYVALSADCSCKGVSLPLCEDICECSMLSCKCMTKSMSECEIVLACFVGHDKKIAVTCKITSDHVPVFLAYLLITFLGDLLE